LTDGRPARHTPSRQDATRCQLTTRCAAAGGHTTRSTSNSPSRAGTGDDHSCHDDRHHPAASLAVQSLAAVCGIRHPASFAISPFFQTFLFGEGKMVLLPTSMLSNQ
jgi:hypothetical protein